MNGAVNFYSGCCGLLVTTPSLPPFSVDCKKGKWCLQEGLSLKRWNFVQVQTFYLTPNGQLDGTVTDVPICTNN